MCFGYQISGTHAFESGDDFSGNLTDSNISSIPTSISGTVTLRAKVNQLYFVFDGSFAHDFKVGAPYQNCKRIGGLD